jgi:hypothetical protein
MALISTDDYHLRLLLGVPQEEELPDDVVEYYLRVQKLVHKLRSGAMSVELLVLICVQTGHLPELPTVRAGAPVQSELVWADVRPNTRIEMKYGKAWREGVFLSADHDRVVVRLDGETQPRSVEPKRVRLP